MKKAIVAAMLIAVCGSVAAANWAKVPGPANVGKFVDLSSITVIGDSILLWERYEHKQAKLLDGKPYLSSVSRVEYGCELRQFRYRHYIFYAGRDQTGEVISNRGAFLGEWIEIIPDSLGEEMFNSVCKKSTT